MKNLLQSAKLEIENLRRTNEILAAKVQTMELFATVLHTEPASFRQGASIDIAWQLQKQIEKLTEDENKPKAPTE